MFKLALGVHPNSGLLLLFPDSPEVLMKIGRTKQSPQMHSEVRLSCSVCVCVSGEESSLKGLTVYSWRGNKGTIKHI